MLYCKECGSSNIAWDAWVDQDGEIINTYDAYICLSCEELTPELIEKPNFEGE